MSTFTKVIAGRMFDSLSMQFLDHQVITVSESTGLIHDVHTLTIEEQQTLDWSDDSVIDLREQTVLPGFVDAHVHLFLHPYSEASWEDQLTKESLVERTVRATMHARATLLAGFTTVRDLGTEGAGDADIALRKCISGPNPIIPGPRYFCANRAIVSSGGYGPKGNLHVNEEGVDGVTGAVAADGADECRKAVRKQIGAGADWIKVYADYRFRSRMADVAPKLARDPMPMFGHDELRAIVDTAATHGVKVAAHCSDFTLYGLDDVARDLDSIEHGYSCCVKNGMNTTTADNGEIVNGDEEALTRRIEERFSGKRTCWVPTLSAYYTMRKSNPAAWEKAQKTFRAALRSSKLDCLRIACGGDTGVFEHGTNALELQLMVALGADPLRVLQWATLGGWGCVRSRRWESHDERHRLEATIRKTRLMNGALDEPRDAVGDNEMPFGVIRTGFSADLIATRGDVENDLQESVTSENITFVMKMGKVYKRDGNATI